MNLTMSNLITHEHIVTLLDSLCQKLKIIDVLYIESPQWQTHKIHEDVAHGNTVIVKVKLKIDILVFKDREK